MRYDSCFRSFEVRLDCEARPHPARALKMSSALSVLWLARLASALDADSAQRAVDTVAALLAEVGSVPVEEGATAAIAAEYAGRKLGFTRGSLDDDTVGLLTPMLSAALRRVAEQEALASARERTEMLALASFEGIMVHVDGSIIDANQRLCEMLGYSYEEILGPETMRRCVAPEDLPLVLDLMRNRYEGAYVITGVRADGSRFRAEPLSKQGKLGDRPVRVVAVRDVTERELTHALLRESESRLRELAEEVFDVIGLSRGGVILEIRGVVEQVLGFSREELIGRQLLDLIAEPSRSLAQQRIREGQPGAYEAHAINRSGAIVPVEVVGVMSTFQGQPVRIAGLRDLRARRKQEEERRELEQRVERAQRLDSLGVLAGGIAHDFNNLLVGVLGNADYLLQELRDSAHEKAAAAIRAAAESASSLTAQMLAYAGQRDRGRREPLELGAIMQEIAQLLGAAISKKAELELAIQPGSTVLGDRATLTQVLMNLLTNASDALGDAAGKIRIASRSVRVPDARWNQALGNRVEPGDWIEIEVSDTGCGISEATLGRIFEPFFSTKPKGHGLGLAACLGIVASHGGAIHVESELSRGSSFRVLLPRAAPPLKPEVVPMKTEGNGCRRILVVDDESIVRSFLRRALERRGYQVTEAPEGVAALSLLAEQSFDVVLLDMNMPRLGGVEVLRKLRESGSGVSVVLSSGYSDVDRGELDPTSYQGFLIKPYGIAELVEVLERALPRATA